MRIVFLDVDGVLNCRSTGDRFHGFIGIDDELVRNLSSFVALSSAEEDTRIVVSSTWRMGQDKDGKSIPDSYKYLQEKLDEHGLEIFDDTPFIKWGGNGRFRRGREIAGWLYDNREKNITGYVVLDDTVFEDFEKYGIMPHLVKTSWENDGGFRKDHIDLALEIIRKQG